MRLAWDISSNPGENEMLISNPAQQLWGVVIVHQTNAQEHNSTLTLATALMNGDRQDTNLLTMSMLASELSCR